MKTSTIAILVFAFGLFLTAIAWPQTITGTYVGIDADKIGKGNVLVPDGQLDHHIKLSGIKNLPFLKVRITDDAVGIWEHPFNSVNWDIAIVQTSTTADLWFAQFQPTQHFTVWITYKDNSTDKITVPLSNVIVGGLAGHVTVSATQTICSSSWINADESVTAQFWPGSPPCASAVGVPLLKITYVHDLAMCIQKTSATNFDLWNSSTMPCKHP